MVVKANGGSAENVVFTIAGRTVTLAGATGADTTYTAANIAAAFTGTASTGITVGGTLTAYTAALSSGNSVLFTATTTGNQTDLTVGKTINGANTIAAGVATPAAAIVDGSAGSASTGANIVATAGNFSGATEFNATNSLNKVTFNGLGDTQAVGIVGNGSVANGDVDYSLAATATKTTINVAGGTKQGTVTNTGASVATAVINSTGTANTLTAIDLGTGTNVTSLTVNAATNLKAGINNDFAATAALTVSGAATSVELTGGNAATFKTIDASGLTAGGLTIGLSTTNTSFKGGQGNDVVTTAAIATTASVDAGAGTADVIVVGAGTDTDSAAKAAVYKNFEVVRTGASQDMSVFTGSTIGAVQVNAGADIAISKMTATQAANVTVRGNVTSTGTGTGLSLVLADSTGTADVATITFGGAGLAPTPDAAKLTVNGFETLNLKAVQGTTTTDLDTSIAAFAADKATAVNLTGTSFDLQNVAGLAKAVTIDGSALTGYLKVAGNFTAGSTVTATAGKDTVALGTAGSTYNLGANDDSITATAVAQLRSGTTYNTIDAGAGVDTLTLTANDVTMIDDDFKGLTNLEKIVLTVNNAANGETITTGGWYDQNFKAAGSDLTITAGAEAVTFAGGTFTGVQKLTVTTAAATQDTIVTTGSGADTVKVTANSLTSGDITVSTGDGVDAIEIDVSTNVAAGAAITVTAGKGADTIKFTELDAADAQYVTVAVGAGDSTITAYDAITGYNLGGTDKSVVIDFAGDSVVAGNLANTSITGYTAAELLYSITNGFLSFSGVNQRAKMTSL